MNATKLDRCYKRVGGLEDTTSMAKSNGIQV